MAKPIQSVAHGLLACLITGCSGNNLTGGDGSIAGDNRDKDKKDKAARTSVETTNESDEEDAKATSPAMIVGAFLVCGQDGDDPSVQRPVVGLERGCAVINANDKNRISCETIDRVKTTYSDGTRGNVVPQLNSPDSFWHFRFRIEEGKDLTAVTAHVTCGGVFEHVKTRSINFVPSKNARGEWEMDATDQAVSGDSIPETPRKRPTHVIFATSATLSGNMMGQRLAQEACDKAALAASRAEAFSPLLTFTPYAPLNGNFTAAQFDRQVENTKGELVADAGQLWSGSINSAILNENGDPVSGPVWTGSNPTGGMDQPASFGARWGTCFEWTSANSSDGGGVGDPTMRDGRWLDTGDGISCDQQAHIYCISR